MATLVGESRKEQGGYPCAILTSGTALLPRMVQVFSDSCFFEFFANGFFQFVGEVGIVDEELPYGIPTLS